MSSVAYYCLHKLHILPHQLMELPENELAFVCAAVAIKVKRDKKEADKLRRKR